MSMKLVKKLLQDHETREREEKEAAADIALKTSRKRKRNTKDKNAPIANDQDAFKATVRNILFLDKKMVNLGSTKKNQIMNRIQRESEKKKKARELVATSVLGNSRASSSQLVYPSEPTFNKKRHQKQKEKERLQKIAKLLNKSSGSKKKRKASVS